MARSEDEALYGGAAGGDLLGGLSLAVNHLAGALSHHTVVVGPRERGSAAKTLRILALVKGHGHPAFRRTPSLALSWFLGKP